MAHFEQERWLTLVRNNQDQLESDKSSIRHFRIAKGSTAELFTQTIISFRIGYLDKDDSNFLKKECQEILGMLTNLIKHRNKL